LGPAQTTWAQSLAQASDQLGKTKGTREVASRVHEQCEGN